MKGVVKCDPQFLRVEPQNSRVELASQDFEGTILHVEELLRFLLGFLDISVAKANQHCD
jgi:hypothetical protein